MLTSTIKALQRDRGQCVLTRTAPPQVAHIVPHAVGKLPGPLRDTQPDIFKLLRYLVGPTVVNRLTDYLLAPDDAGRTHINRLENLISLSTIVHEHFGKGWLVLEPVGDVLSALGAEQALWTYELKFSWVPTNRPCPVRLRGTSQVGSRASFMFNSRAARYE